MARRNEWGSWQIESNLSDQVQFYNHAFDQSTQFESTGYRHVPFKLKVTKAKALKPAQN